MRKILVPIDFSPTSAVALRYATFLADLSGYTLSVIHVRDEIEEEAGIVEFGGCHPTQAWTEQRMATFVRQNVPPPPYRGLRELGRPPRLELRAVTGNAPTALVVLSRDASVRLIVMGGVGEGQQRKGVHSYPGSVARTVELLGEAPVLLIPKGFGAPGSIPAAFSSDFTCPLRIAAEGAEFLLDALQRAPAADSPGYPAAGTLSRASNFTDTMTDQVMRYDIDLLIHSTLEALCGRLNQSAPNRQIPPGAKLVLAA